MEHREIENNLANGGGDCTGGCVQEVARQVREELRQLYQQRAEVKRRIWAVKRTMSGLAALFGDNGVRKEPSAAVEGSTVERKPGFTKACRSILMKAGDPLSAREVHDRLNEDSPSLLSALRHPMTSVTTVLNRLADYGEAERVLLGNGRRAWQWIAESGGVLPASATEAHASLNPVVPAETVALQEDVRQPLIS